MTSDPEVTIEQAEGILRRQYDDHVQDLADSIRYELKDRIKDGEEGEQLHEWLIEHMHETIDGNAWVIYTRKAQWVLMFSDNDGAYADNFGDDGIVKDGSIQWSALAFCALEQDVYERLDNDGIDVNDPFESDAFEDLRNEMAARETCKDLSREVIVKALNAASIDCRETETDDVLREALVQNIIDGTINELDIDA